MKKSGQKTAVFILVKNDVTYPLNGATRLGCLLALNAKKVKARKIPKRMGRKWNHSFERCLEGLPKEVMDAFNFFLSKKNEDKNNENTS